MNEVKLQELKTIKIVCPICHKSKRIQVPSSIREADTGALTTVSIPNNLVCEHHFQAYIDKNFNVRGYQKVDFTLEIPEIEQNEELHDREDDIDLFIIKINFSQNTLARLLRSTIFRRKSLYVSDSEMVRNQLEKFFSYLLKGIFENSITTAGFSEYRKNKKKYKKYLVFHRNEIARDPYKKEDKDMDIEKNIVSNFIFNAEDESSLIFLRNEIRKLYTLSEGIKKFIESFDGDKVSTVDVREFVKNEFGVDIKNKYLEFLFEIIEKYFEVSPPQLYGNLAEFF